MKKSAIERHSKHTNRAVEWLESVKVIKPSGMKSYWAAERDARGKDELYICVFDSASEKYGKLLVPSPLMSRKLDDTSALADASIAWIEAIGITLDHAKREILVVEGVRLDFPNGEHLIVRSAGNSVVADASGKMKPSCKMLKSPNGRFQAINTKVKAPAAGKKSLEKFMRLEDWVA